LHKYRATLETDPPYAAPSDPVASAIVKISDFLKFRLTFDITNNILANNNTIIDIYNYKKQTLLKGSTSMHKRMMIIMRMGIIGVLVGITMAVLGFTPKSVPALITTISASWIGVAIAIKLNKGTRDEMVVRIEHVSAYYTFIATLYLIFMLMAVRQFTNLTLSVGALLFALAMFMCASYLLLKHVLLRRGNAE
jgi:hypothetical protein